MYQKFFSQDDLKLLMDAYKEKAFVHSPTSNKAKFLHLMPWKEINRIIKQCRLEHPRLRLHKEGNSISEHLYTEFQPLRRGNGYNKIIETKLYEQLQNGATLIIDSIDDLSEELDVFAGNIERIFKNKLQVNAYMSWGNNTKGFTTHWDDHDVLILQVYGRKHWFVFNETRKYPLYRDLHKQHNPPTTPSWDKVIEAGDILFIPRGQWHHAVAINEPSLHLTFGFNCRTGINYIQWLQDKLTDFEICRKDIPAFTNHAELGEYHKLLIEKLIGIANAHPLDKYLKDLEFTIENRPLFSLPWAGSAVKNIPENLKIIFNTLLISNYQNTETTVKFSALNKQYEFSSLCDPLFKTLMDYQPHTVTDLLKMSNGKLTQPQLEEVISSLVKDGLLAVAE